MVMVMVDGHDDDGDDNCSNHDHGHLLAGSISTIS